MKKMFKVTVLCALVCLLYSGINDAQETDKGLFEKKCSFCHEKERPLSKRKNTEGWTDTVKRMQSKDPGRISDGEAERIIGYLSFVRGEETNINKANDPSNLSDLEKIHVPEIQIEKENAEKKTSTITVNVGEVPHPMEMTHYIKTIEIFVEGASAGKAELKPEGNPEAVFHSVLIAGRHVTARAVCTIHGIWEGD